MASSNVVQIQVYVKPDVAKECDRLAKLGGLSRSELAAAMIEVACEYDAPPIELGFRLGSAAKRMWPGKWPRAAGVR